MTVSGTVTFQRLQIQGFPARLGPALVTKPARFVDVEVRSLAGACYGSTSTDATGAYSLVVRPPAGTSLQVYAWTRSEYDALRNVTVHNDLAPSVNTHCNGNVFRHASSTFPEGANATVNFLVPYNPGHASNRPSIGFNVYDVLVGCTEGIRLATGTVPPVCHAYVKLGNNADLGGVSFLGISENALSILGGAAGLLDTSDTDYFDDGVVAHEYHHFVEFNVCHTLSRPENHGSLTSPELEPGFAWSEGHATGFGCLVRGDPLYIDTSGTGGVAGGFTWNVESVAQTNRGIGSEHSVFELLWDLGDGTGGIPDTDLDGVAAPLSALYGAYVGFVPATDSPYLGLLLDRLVAGGSVTAPQITGLTLAPENHSITYPLAGNDVWPLPLPRPGSVNGTADHTGAAGLNYCRACTAWYRLILAAPAVVNLNLTITPIAGFGSNLNLYVAANADKTVTPFALSTNPGGAPENISGLNLAAGTYLVIVQAAPGDKANFTLNAN
jgi:hypothetical protein